MFNFILPVTGIIGGCLASHCTTQIYINLTQANIYYSLLVLTIHSYCILKGNYRLRLANLCSVTIKNKLICLLLPYALSTYINNLIWQYNITPVDALCIRSCSPLFYLLVGYLVFGLRYNPKQYAIAGGLCLGLILISIDLTAANDQSSYLGLSLLIMSNCLISLVGHLQSQILRQDVLMRDILLVTTHLISLPVYYLNAEQVLSWVTILIHTLGQYICLRSVYWLLQQYDILTLNIVLTLRKLLAITWSYYYLEQSITISNLLGMSLIFACTLLYYK